MAYLGDLQRFLQLRQKTSLQITAKKCPQFENTIEQTLPETATDWTNMEEEPVFFKWLLKYLSVVFLCLQRHLPALIKTKNVQRQQHDPRKSLGVGNHQIAKPSGKHIRGGNANQQGCKAHNA